MPAQEAPLRARVPANVEQKDQDHVRFDGTAAGHPDRHRPADLHRLDGRGHDGPPLVFAVAALPVAGIGFVFAVGRRDGVSLDAWFWPRSATAAARTAWSPPRSDRPGPGLGDHDRRPRQTGFRSRPRCGCPRRGSPADGLIDLGSRGHHRSGGRLHRGVRAAHPR